MRIISGKFKGTKLKMPDDKSIRPLKDMVRESIFNFLIHSNKILFEMEKSNILDLYSGTGSFGLECLSRQAKQVVFVENEKSSAKILEKNIEKLKVKDISKVFLEDAFKIIKEKEKNIHFQFLEKKFNLIFCDPPFKNENIDVLIEMIFLQKILEKNGIIILHRHKNTKDIMPNYFKILDERVYGLSKIIFGNFYSSSS
jgi:16S rRNA (guanine966-N2)-methyltransferase